MTSQVQSEANRRNALKSTGPKSKKGKGRARLNALKHGLRAKDIVLPSEDGREFDGLRRALITELEPEGSLEEQLAERIVVCLWRLRRVYPIEVGIFRGNSLTMENNYAIEEANRRGHESVTKANLRREAQSPGAAFRHDAVYGDAIGKLSRYETAIERSLFRALHALEQLRATRREREASALEIGDAPDNLRQVQQLSSPRNGG